MRLSEAVLRNIRALGDDRGACDEGIYAEEGIRNAAIILLNLELDAEDELLDKTNHDHQDL